jgi:hypothetical protein
MTKRLEELFNLDPAPKLGQRPDARAISADVIAKAAEVKSMDDSYNAVSTITNSLPLIVELNDLGEFELDALAAKAEQAYDDLMDLGMNVEVRYASRIFEVAGTLLRSAIDAKSAKIDKRLKAVDLQLKKLKIDRDSPAEDSNSLLEGNGYIITDRNELLKKLGQK